MRKGDRLVKLFQEKQPAVDLANDMNEHTEDPQNRATVDEVPVH